MAPAMLFYDTSSPPKNKKTSKEILGLNLRKIKPRRLAVLDWRWSRLTRRWFVLIPLFLYLVIGPVPFLALRDSITALVQEQKIVNSYSTSCAGEWQNSQGAQGLPELDEGAAFDLFSEVNSAVYTGGPVNLICGGFQEEKSQTAAAKKSLGIFWGKKIIAASPASSGAAATNATNATEAINATEPSPAAESALSPESQPEAIQPEESSASASAALNATSESSGSSHIIILNPEPASAPAASDAAPEEPTDNPAASSPAVASPQNEKQIESAQILLSFAMGDKTSDFTPVSAAPAGKKTAPKSIFSKIGKLFAGRIVYAEEGSSTAAINATNTTEATNATTATEAPTEIESPVETPAAEPETSASTTETLAPAQENSSSTDSQPVTETFLQNLDTRVIVWYSLDGQEWWKLTDLNSFPTSNAINGGYLAFDAPFLKTADDIKSLQIKLEGAWSGDQQITAYLDSVWVRAAYSGEGVNTDDFSLLSKKDFKMGENAEVRVRYKKQGYVLSLFGEALGIQDYWKDLKTTFRVVDPEGNEVGVSSIGGDVREDDQYSFSVKLLRQGEMALQFSGAASFKPGKYRIFMTVEDDSGSQPFTQEFEQDFTLGVLAVNVSKSIYLPGEQAYLQMAALNDRGRTLCNAYLNLEVTAPDGKIDLFSTDFANPQAAAPEEPVAENSSPEDLLVLFGVANVAAEAALATDSAPAEPAQPAEASSTESAPQIGFAPEESAPQTEQVPVAETPAETPAATPAETPAETSPEIPAEAPTPAATETGKIEMSGACTGDSYAEKPDYFAYYQTSAAGAYQMKFSNMDTGAEITDSFEVRDYVPFDVERIGPTRIFPPSTYKVTLKVKANEDFSGDITERVPGDFVIKEISPDLSSAVEHREQFSVLVDPRTREIGWQANLKQNDSVELSYKFRAPNVSPYLYLLGPLRFESRSFFAGIMEKAKDFIGDILQKPVDAIRGLANTENSSLYSDFVQNRGKPNTENSSLYSDSGGNPENQQEIQFTEVFKEARQWSIAADATLTLYPNATGTYRVWPTIVATTTAWGATSDLSDTTYIQSASSSTATETEAMQDFSGLAGSSINSVTINTRCCAANGGGAGEKGAVILYTNGAGYQYDDQTISRCDTWETNTSGALTANPQSGNPWTIAEVDAMETGKKPTSVGAAEAIRCSEFEAVVDYTIPPEGPPSVWDYSVDTPDPVAQGATLTFSVGWQDTEAGISWTSATTNAQWPARDGHTSLVFNNQMWVIGGLTTDSTNDVWYSGNGTTWTQATTNAQWAGRYQHTSLVFNNQMWALGGYTTTSTNDVWYSSGGELAYGHFC
ncbi:MAG: Kelch repeat type 1-containing protein, partial [Parcubacteria group bacterium GW2011_GWA2_47_9]